jgi:hypothetical protein
MKETQQVMNNKPEEQYLSLYEYLGHSSKQTGLGKEVLAEALKQKLDIRYKMLPKEMQKPEYNQVNAYPLSFLDEYFANKLEFDMTPIVRRSGLIEIESKLKELETRIEELTKQLNINVTNSNEYHDDDLPF